MNQETRIPTSLDLCLEAKRQSLLACESDKASEQDLWESNYDQSGWE